MNMYDVIEELKESFNYYSIEDINTFYEFIKKNETNGKKVVYDKERNTLRFE